MNVPLYQVDAFADRPFAGNPAAVCPLEAWLPDATLQAIAAENNLSETAFLVRRGEEFDLRWFTPAIEVDLCGHATLASAHVVLSREPERESVRFHTASGPLTVHRAGALLEMDFPSQPGHYARLPTRLATALGGDPVEIVVNDAYWLVAYRSPAEVLALDPDFKILGEESRGFVPTAPGEDVDFVSRMFAPYAGVDEDPVCGSSHCLLTPYWAERLGRTRLTARQISRRGGELACTLEGDRVRLAGEAVLYLEGHIEVPAD